MTNMTGGAKKAPELDCAACNRLQMNPTAPVLPALILPSPCDWECMFMGQSPLITESLWWWGSTESVVWFMLTYWGLIWARIQPPGSICSGSEVRMSWKKINRLPGWRPGMMVNWRNCPCWMGLLDHFNLYWKHSQNCFVQHNRF